MVRHMWSQNADESRGTRGARARAPMHKTILVGHAALKL